MLGDLKYPPEFPHFDYINPAAPKAGIVRQTAVGTYDNFNLIIDGLKGDLVIGIDLLFETLLVPSLDEVSSAYGLLAEAVHRPSDFSSVSYRLRSEAKWHDGVAITPDDVIFSFNAFKQHSPRLSAYYQHVTKAEATGAREVTFTFDSAGNHELPQIVGELQVLPKHWWEAANASGDRRNVAATTLEAPLGSGPYCIQRFDAGRSISYRRVDDYWGRDLNVRIGQNNFDELRFDYFRDFTVAFEAFKAGDFDWQVENSAKNWATGYNFPAVAEKRVVLEQFPIRNTGIMQAFTFNIRRNKFKNPLLRRAFNFAFDFERVNAELFYGQYERITSYFQNTELAATGLPGPQELQILDSLRDDLPPEVFTTAYWNPSAPDGTSARRNLLQAMALLEQAGFPVRDLKLVNIENGEPLQVEFLLAE